MKKIPLKLLFLVFFISLTFSMVINNQNTLENQTSDDYVRDQGSNLGIRDVYERSVGSNTYVTEIVVSGDYAYLSCYGSSDRDLAVIDISDPTNPGPNYYAQLDISSYGLFVDGDYAYIASSQTGLTVVDISDPTNPTFLAHGDAGNSSLAIWVEGDYAYVAQQAYGLAIYNISHPGNPNLVTYAPVSNARDVMISGNYAYVANRFDGISVVDITDPTNPSIVGSRDIANTLGTVGSICVEGDFCYGGVGGNNPQIAIFNISDPTNPSVPVYVNLTSTNDPSAIQVVGDFCYIGQMFSGLAVVDISNPMKPGKPYYQTMYQNRAAIDIFLAGVYAYVAIEDWGLNVVKIGEYITPIGPYTTTTTGTARKLTVSGDHAFVADLAGGLASVDITDPMNPNVVSSFGAPSSTYDVFVHGNYAYLTSAIAGLSVYNITDPNNIDYIGTQNTDGNARGIFISGDYAYVADWSYLAVLNISNPASPGAPTNYAVSGQCWGVYIMGDFVYAACGDAGLAIFNNSDPESLGTPVYKNTTGYAYDVYVSGDFAFIADSTSGLAIINISDPMNLGEPVYVPTSNAQDVDVYGDRAYVADYDEGLVIINVTDPTNPNTLMNKTTGGSPYGVCVSGDYVYLGDGNFAAIRTMLPWYAVNITTLNPITPNLDNDGIINLDWTSVENATIYYLYRESASITTMTGLTPIGTTPNTYYTDHLSADGQYYYAVVAGNSRGKGWISNSENVSVDITFLNQGSFGAKYYAPNDTFVLDTGLGVNEWYGFYLDCNGSFNYDLVIQQDGTDFHSSTMGTGQDDWVLWYPGGDYNWSAIITYSSGGNATYQYHYMNSTTRALGPGHFTRWFAGNGELLRFNVPSSSIHYMKLYNSSGIRARLYGPGLPGSKRDASYVAQMELIALNDSTYVDSTWLAAAGWYTILINRIDNSTSYRNYTLEFCNDLWGPSSFGLVSPTEAVIDQTPTVIGEFWETGIGVDVSNVEYAYATDGDLTPTNWTAVDGVFRDAACTIPAQDYDSGQLYAKVNAVPFNQASDTNNTIRFQARDMTTQLGTQASAFTIVIDTFYSVNQNDYGINQLTYGNDTYILNPIPLPTGWWYGFYLGLNGTQDYDLMIRQNSTDWRESTQGPGEDEWVIWSPGTTYMYTAEARYVSGPNTTYQYQFINTTFLSSFGWYHRTFSGRAELLQVNLASFGDYVLKLNNSPGIRAQIFGPAGAGNSFYASGAGPAANVYAPDPGLYTSIFSASGTYVILVTREDGYFNASYSLFIEKDDLAPGNFTLIDPLDWINNQTPSVICQFMENESGLDPDSVQYAYSTDGNSAPTNWVDADGVFLDPGCSLPAPESYIGIMYIKVNAVPFNQDSGINNTIRFRVGDQTSKLGTQTTAFIIKIDTIYSVNQTDYGIHEITALNDTYILNPQPLPTGQYYGFYMDCTGGYDYDLMVRRNYTDWVGSTSGSGLDDWVIWYAANNYIYTAEVRYGSGPNETYQYTFFNTSSISFSSGWQVRSFVGKGELLELTLASATTYTLRLTNAANVRARLYGPSAPSFARQASGAAPLADLYAPDNGGYALTFSVGTAGTYILLVNLENDNFNKTYTMFINDDTLDPMGFSIESPIDWVINQTPTIIGEFSEALGSGIDISTVEYAYATDGNLTPDNWQPVNGVFKNLACTINASDYDYGWFYAKVTAVPFYQDSSVNNTIRFRARDMTGNLGTQATAIIIKIDSVPASFSLHSPTDWINNQTPTVICQITLGPLSGINSSTVEFAYATDGNLTPGNWAPVEGIYNDSACTVPVGDSYTGIIYARVIAVPFNQDHETDNVIRFRATTMAGLSGNSSAYSIKIDTGRVFLFGLNLVSAGWLANQTPEVHFYFVVSNSGLNVSSVEYSYSTDGNQSWSSWAVVDGVWNESDYSNVAEDGETGLIWAMVNAVPFGQDSDVNNTIRFRVGNMIGNLGVSENFTIKIDTLAPQITVQQINGTYYTVLPNMDVDFSDTYTLDSAYYKVDSFNPTGNDTTDWTPIFVNLDFVASYGNNFVMDIAIWGNLTEGNHTVYFKVWDDAGNVNDGSTPIWQFCKDTTIPKISSITIAPIDPRGGDTITITISLNQSTIASGVESAVIFVNLGSGWIFGNMTPSESLYIASIPTSSNHTSLQYFIEINDTAGNHLAYGNATNPFSIVLGSYDDISNDGNWIIYVVIIAAVAAVAVTMIVLRSRKPSPQGELPPKLVPPKLDGRLDRDGMINHLRANEIAIEDVPNLQNADLNQLLKESLQTLAPEDFQLLQGDEFNELSNEEKEEILKDLMLLSKEEKQDLLIKLKGLSEELGKD